MTVSATNTTSTGLPYLEPENPFKPVGDSELDRQDFMTLFITQLQYQDPMKPMDSYEMASQMAQFSNMEATMKVADNMEKLLNYQISQNNLQLLNLIGKSVQAIGDQIGVVNGTANPTEFTLANATDRCFVNVYDAAGHLVDIETLGYQASGLRQFAWDAKNTKGEIVKDGAYRYEVQAYDAAGQEVAVEYRSTGKVTGVDFNSGVATVQVDGHVNMSVGDIITVE